MTAARAADCQQLVNVMDECELAGPLIGHPFTGELDSVRMPQLMRREPAPDTRSKRVSAQLPAHRGRRPRPPAGGPVDHAEQPPMGSSALQASHGAR